MTQSPKKPSPSAKERLVGHQPHEGRQEVLNVLTKGKLKKLIKAINNWATDYESHHYQMSESIARKVEKIIELLPPKESNERHLMTEQYKQEMLEKGESDDPLILQILETNKAFHFNFEKPSQQ